MAPDPLWQLDRVSLGPARLCEISLEIRHGVTAIIGWSGAGKTSLLNVLAAFERPTSGAIQSPNHAIAKSLNRLAWVPQNGGLWPHCTAREHLEIASGRSRAGALHDAGLDALLATFDLAEKCDARPGELSQGEQSRLAVVRALAMRAEVLVMDEPLAHVDPARAGNYWRAIREHVRGSGASLVFSTHAPETVLGEAQRVVCLREGRVVHEGDGLELYERPPDAELMNFLGAGNWLTADEARLWLGIELAAARCFRPEQIAIEPATDGAVVVESARFMGSLAECELRHTTHNLTRLFAHRPAGALLRKGERATVRVR